MKQNFLAGLLGSFVGVALLLLIMNATGLVSAQGPTSQRDESNTDRITVEAQPLSPSGGGGPNVPLGTTFTYQGQLKINGAPYTGNCDMQFALWNGQPGSGILITTVLPIPTLVPVTGGLFMVYLNFGDQFQGDYRQIEPHVRCPSGSGAYQTLDAQVIYPAPYALSLRPGATISGTADPALTINDNFANGIALEVDNMADANYSTGVYADSFTGRAIVGYSLAMTGTGIGVVGIANSPTGVGVAAQGGSAGGAALRIWAGGIQVSNAGINTDTPVFIHQVKTGASGNICSIQSYSTVIDNPLINGQPGAILIVTPNYGSRAIGIAPAVGIPAVYYDAFGDCGKGAGRWVIYNLDSTAQVNNSLFNVMAVTP